MTTAAFGNQKNKPHRRGAEFRILLQIVFAIVVVLPPSVMSIVVVMVAVGKPVNGHIVVTIVMMAGIVSVNVTVVMMPVSISERRQRPSRQYSRSSNNNGTQIFHEFLPLRISDSSAPRVNTNIFHSPIAQLGDF